MRCEAIDVHLADFSVIYCLEINNLIVTNTSIYSTTVDNFSVETIKVLGDRNIILLIKEKTNFIKD
jgi:hypothetical protein